jgi:hypothetical protein
VSEAGPDPVPRPAEHPIVDFTFDDLTALLRRAIRNSAVVGVAVAIFLWLGMGWQTAALFAVGGAISVGSIYEWGRLIRVFGARLAGQETGQKAGQKAGQGSGLGTGLVVFLFLVRLILFAGAIYGSLKCFHGSPIALFGGLALGLSGLVWEALRALRG